MHITNFRSQLYLILLSTMIFVTSLSLWREIVGRPVITDWTMLVAMTVIILVSLYLMLRGFNEILEGLKYRAAARTLYEGELKGKKFWIGTECLIHALINELNTSVEGRSKPEHITHAATRHPSGIIFAVEAPGRHHHCISKMYLMKMNLMNSERDQGFITSDGRYVDRHEALEIAMTAGQLKEMPHALKTKLFTEDIW